MTAAGPLPFGLLRGPREVLFGVGQRAALPAVVARSGTRPLVVTDAHLAGERSFAGLLDALTGAGARVRVFADALPDLPLHQVSTAADLARRHGADVVVGIGGGSCLDLAKAVALLVAHGGRPQDYYGENRVPGPTVPVVAVPTTAGTGSEVTPVAVLTDPDRTSKIGISSRHLIPTAAVCDPELTLTCPAGVTAAAGADALSHAIEAFTAVRRAPEPGLSTERVAVGKGVLTDVFALLAIGQVSAWLHRAVTCPDDIEARSGMALAALAGGYAFGTAGTGAAHALQYPVGALTHTPHGVGVGVLLPYVMSFNLPVRIPELAEVARALGIVGAEAGNGADRALAERAVDAVVGLLASIGIPSDLAALGMPVDQLGWAAAESMNARRLVDNNPRLLDEPAALAVLQAAHAGNRDQLTTSSQAPAPATPGTRSAA